MAPEYLTQMFHVSVNQTYQLRNNHQKLYLYQNLRRIFLKEDSPIGEQFHGTKF